MKRRAQDIALTGTLVLAMGAGPIVVFIYSATGPMVIDRFHLTNADFGRLASTAFVSAALASTVLGRVVDRVPPVFAVIGLQGLTAGALLLVGFGSSLLAVAVALVLSGLVQAIGNPVTNRIVATGVPAGRRGAVMGVKQSGVQMSQLVAGLLAAPLAVSFGWTFSFVAAVPVAVLGAVLGVMALRDAGRPSSQARVRSPRTRVPSSVWPLAGYAVLTGAALQASIAYLPMFAFDALGWPVELAGLTVSLVGAAGVCARIFWGHRTERLSTIAAPLVTVALGGATGIGLFIVALALQQGWLLWVGLAVFGLTGVAANVIVMVAVVGLAPLELLGRASGVLATGLFVGFALGPASFGVLVDATGGYLGAWCATGVLYLLASVLAARIGVGPR